MYENVIVSYQKMHRNWLTDIIGLAILFTLFYSLWLGSYPLFTPDEGRYSEVAREMIVSHDYITPRVNGVAFLDKPILYYWLQAIAIHLFGLKEWALRLFPALIGIFGCLITYLCGRQLFDRRTGLLSAVILATSPLYFVGAHYADLNLEVAVFISCSLLFFITGIKLTHSLRSLSLFAAYLFASLAFLTKGLIGLAFPCMITGSFILLLWRFELLKKVHLLKGLLFFCILVGPWYVLVQKANPEFLHYFFVTQQIGRFLSADSFNNKTPFWFYAPIVFIGFFPWVIFLAQSLFYHLRNIYQSRHDYLTELFLLLWLGMTFIFFSIPQSKTIGYIFPLFPALALLVGSYLTRQWEKAKQFNIYLSIVCLILLSSLFTFLLLMLPIYKWLALPPEFMPFLKKIALILMSNAVIACFLIKKETLLPLYALCTLCSTLFLLTLTVGATHLNQSSAKPLALHLKTLLQPQDEVVNYFKYYQDIPLYLEKKITIVANWNAPDIATKDNWMRELWYGMQFQKTDDWLINENTFWERWKSNKRLFVFVNANYFNQFKSHKNHYFYIGKYKDIILVSNQP